MSTWLAPTAVHTTAAGSRGAHSVAISHAAVSTISAIVKSRASASGWRVSPGTRPASGPTIHAGKPCRAGPERNDGRSAAARTIAPHRPTATPSAAVPAAPVAMVDSAPARAWGRGTRMRCAAGVAAMRGSLDGGAVRRYSRALSARERRVGIVFGGQLGYQVPGRRADRRRPFRHETGACAALDHVLHAEGALARDGPQDFDAQHRHAGRHRAQEVRV